MNDYIQVDFKLEPFNEIEVDILDALLCDAGYESFVATDDGVSAFIKQEIFEGSVISDIIGQYPFKSKITWNEEYIVGQDWNEEWEKNFFKPMVIAGKCVIHSTFHADYPKLKYDITIDPKMAFGTGHHSTTSLIVSELLSMNLQGKSILDMGTGTGILSIVGVKHGANHAVGVEIDEAAYTNALENIQLNEVSDKIELHHGDVSAVSKYADESFDIVLANINRNVIVADIDKYTQYLKKDGVMLLSGFYTEDVEIVEKVAQINNLTALYMKSDNNWVLLVLKKV